MIGYRPAVVKAFVLVALLVSACGGGPSPSASSAPTALSSPHPVQATASASAAPTTGPSAQPATPPGQRPTTSAASGSPLGFDPAWGELQIANGPSAREDHTWTVDGEGEVAYLFGGRGADGPLDDLWAFDMTEATWAPVHITVDLPVPAARFGHTATWVPDVGLVVWSGQGAAGFFDDVWAYEPEANLWRQLPSSGDVPPARYGSCASVGPDAQLWISHGFTQDSGRFSDTRSYDFATGIWTDRTPHHNVPVKRCLHDCFWSTGGRLILYGGQTTGVPALGDIWSYDPAAVTWTEGPRSDAAPRQLYGLAVVAVAAAVFGGGSVDGGFLNDMWFIDPVTLEMRPSDTPGATPPERSGASLIDGGARALLFGGTNADGLLGDLWQLHADT